MVSKRFLTTALTGFAAASLLAACGDSASEEEVVEVTSEETGEPDAISQRQALLEEMGDAFTVIREQLEGDGDIEAMIAAAATINANAAQFIDYFPEGTSMSSGADTEALDTIWEDPEGFAAAHQRLLDESQKMVNAVATGDLGQIGQQVMPLGMSCGNCHDTFRYDDEA